MSNRLRIVVPCLLFVAAALCGCHTPPAAGPGPVAPVAPASPPAAAPTPPASPLPPTAATPAPVKDALTELLASAGSNPFPKGTKVVSVDLKDGVATVNFSKEFNLLANSGDSVESEAQKALRAALARFPDVQKMRVTVEGKPFESGNTDWTTPFPVRDGAPVAADSQGARP